MFQRSLSLIVLSLTIFSASFAQANTQLDSFAYRAAFKQEQMTWDSKKAVNAALCASFQGQLVAGDLIFIAIDNFLFRRVAASTLSWTSHVGIVLPDESGKLMVYEAKIPFAKKTPICDFVGRTAEGKVAVRRLGGMRRLSLGEVERMRVTAEGMIGKFYDTGFNLDSKRKMFCSRFVYEVYQAIGVEVGTVETFQQLLDRNNSPELVRFWKLWFFGRVPWERRTVTPASQMNDGRLATVFSNGI